MQRCYLDLYDQSQGPSSLERHKLYSCWVMIPFYQLASFPWWKKSKVKTQQVVSPVLTAFLGQHFKDCPKSQVVYFKVQLTEQTMIIIIKNEFDNTFDGKKSYYLLSAYYMPNSVKHLTLFSTDGNVMRNYFYHFYFTAMEAKAQRGMILTILCFHTFLAINKWTQMKQRSKWVYYPW